MAMILPKRNSKNVKLGKGVRATYRTVGDDGAGTCPATCAHLASGACYAMHGRVAIHQRRAERAESDAGALLAWLATLPEDTLVRHHVSGDVCTDGTPDHNYIRALRDGHEAAASGVRGYGYTHAWKDLDPLDLNGARVTFNASADTMEDADRAADAGWPVTVVVGEEHPRLSFTPAGRRVVVCPNQTRGVTCAECLLCARPAGPGRPVVAFRVHGAGKGNFDG